MELTYNWDPEVYSGGRNFGHLAYAVENIYDYCAKLQAEGITINRPPRDGRMAFIRTPDNISIELLQAGEALPPPSRGSRCRTPEFGEARVSIFQRIEALTRLRKRTRKYSLYSGACTIRIANRESRGETQNAVPGFRPRNTRRRRPPSARGRDRCAPQSRGRSRGRARAADGS